MHGGNLIFLPAAKQRYGLWGRRNFRGGNFGSGPRRLPNTPQHWCFSAVVIFSFQGFFSYSSLYLFGNDQEIVSDENIRSVKVEISPLVYDIESVVFTTVRRS